LIIERLSLGKLSLFREDSSPAIVVLERLLHCLIGFFEGETVEFGPILEDDGVGSGHDLSAAEA